VDRIGGRTPQKINNVTRKDLVTFKEKMRKAKEKVICAMSGGVDSSVAAALLKRAGFDVTGVFMRLSDLPKFKEGEKRAEKVAKILGIPFLSLDLRKEFKKRVVDLFLKEYKKGFTPNPCVVCNKEIKFGILLEKALELGADYVATGHYARKQKIEYRKQKIEYRLLRGKDKEKDQSYFLWMLNQDQLKRILFPVGNYTKSQVRQLAKKFKLPVLSIPESQEICFVQPAVEDFLTRYLKSKLGKIVDTQGKVVSEHQGLWFYTIGQRKRIGLAGGPHYVLDKDLKKNNLIVTKKEKDLYKKELKVKEVHWISGKAPKLLLKVKAKIRYRHQPASATISKSSKSKVLNLKFDKSQRAITPGQSVVFYSPTEVSTKVGKGQELLGGGIIC